MTVERLIGDQCGSIDVHTEPDLRLALLSGELTHGFGAEIVRIRAGDLKRAARAGEAARRSATRDGQRVSVLLDIEVLLDDEPARAWRNLDELQRSSGVAHQPTSLVYVGTVSGLASLLADIQVLGIADGATLLPLSDGDEHRIIGQLMPLLESRALVAPPRTVMEPVAAG